MLPNKYLRDIVAYGTEYLNRVQDPAQITIQQSRPYRMWNPRHQADFFRLLANVLFYIVKGEGNVGFLAAQPWNPCYAVVTSGPKHKERAEDAEEIDKETQNVDVSKAHFPADVRLK